MSRKGKLPIPLPKGVEVKVLGTEVFVEGPKGSLHLSLVFGVQVRVEGDHILVALEDKSSDLGHYHGLYRALIQNMVTGATEGFQKHLEMIGVGYRATVQGEILDLQLGFSHPTTLVIPKGLTVKVDKNTQILISGVDKRLVGEFAATVRRKRKPEPYQGKGIRYVGEYVRKKAGKTAAKK